MGDAGLSSLLSSLKISSPDAKEIAGMAKAGGYQLACQRHFEVTHPGWNTMDLKIVSIPKGFWWEILRLTMLLCLLLTDGLCGEPS